MNTALHERLTQFHFCFQHALLPLKCEDLEQSVTAPLERLLRIWEWIEIERFVPSTRGYVGRPAKDRAALARAFVAKAVFGLTETSALVERLNADGLLRRLCGFDIRQRTRLSESLFSRAFSEFSAQGLPQRVHEALIHNQLKDVLVEHLSRDSTAIATRERPVKKEPVAAAPARRRGRPCQGEVRSASKTRLEQQADGMSLTNMLADLPRACDVGSKCNAQGFKSSWIGYKLHLDVADGMIPISAIITSASVHDSQVALPLATLSAQRIVNLYDLMDAAYCSPLIRAHSEQLGHVPVIDHNPRRGEKIHFDPPKARRFKHRTTVERVNARLKDSFGAHRVNVRGHTKVAAHLMFAVLALTADQLLRYLT
jgi:hypothetical protein